MPLKETPDSTRLQFLSGGGEMGKLIRSLDWSATSVGDPETWPSVLKHTVSMMLGSAFPMLVCWGPDYIQLYNDAFRPINGRDKHPEALGGSAAKTYAEIWAAIGPMFSRVMQGETVSIPEFMVRLERNGYPEDCYFDFSYSPIKDEFGEVRGILVVCVEITGKVTALKELEEKHRQQQEALISEANHKKRLKESERKLYQIIDLLPAAIIILIGPEFIVECTNPSNLAYWQKSSGQVLGKRLLDILPELEGQPFPGQLKHVLNTGETVVVYEGEVNLKLDDGTTSTTYVDYTYQPLTNQSGERIGVLVMSNDVTERVESRRRLEKSEAALHSINDELAASLEHLNLALRKVEQSEENFRNVIEQAPSAMCLLSGPEHVIELVNNAMLETWGKFRPDVIDKPVFDVLPEARDQGLEDLMKEVYRTGDPFIANEQPVSLIRYGKPDTVYQNFVYQPYFSTQGEILGILAISNDVTGQVMARRKLEQSEAELLDIKNQLEAELEAGKLIQQQKDGFIGMASHELKTPLTSLNAIIQVANAKLKNSGEPFLSGAMEKASNQIKRMNNLVNGFLNISRLESGQVRIDKSDFDLNELLKEVVSEHRLTVSTHHLNMEISSDETYIRADREKIGSVVSNLLNNAIKYSPNGKHIYIRCGIINEKALVSIKDEGIGIRAEDLKKVFDRYYRVETDYTQHISGFGIGLYLSADIIHRHNGEIWVESEPGAGATFCFSLPLIG